MRTPNRLAEFAHADDLGPIPFPGGRDADEGRASPDGPRPDFAGTTDELLEAFDGMSRRIDDLARQLNCLGYFDDDDDGPRAA